MLTHLSLRLPGLNRVITKFGNLSLQPEDVVFCFYGAFAVCTRSVAACLTAYAPTIDIRERDGGVADITTRERSEEAASKVLKLLSF